MIWATCCCFSAISSAVKRLRCCLLGLEETASPLLLPPLDPVTAVVRPPWLQSARHRLPGLHRRLRTLRKPRNRAPLARKSRKSRQQRLQRKRNRRPRRRQQQRGRLEERGHQLLTPLVVHLRLQRARLGRGGMGHSDRVRERTRTRAARAARARARNEPRRHSLRKGRTAVPPWPQPSRKTRTPKTRSLSFQTTRCALPPDLERRSPYRELNTPHPQFGDNQAEAARQKEDLRVLLEHFDENQMDRYEAYRRSGLTKSSVRKASRSL